MTKTIPAALEGERVDRVVAMLADLPRSQVAEMVAAGAVMVSGRPVTSRSHRVVQGQRLDVELPERAAIAQVEADPDVRLSVVHADDDVIVVDKPAGLVVHPGAGAPQSTLIHGLVARFPDLLTAGAGEPHRPGIVHRLDKGTSGLMVVARTPPAYRSLAAQVRHRRVDRRYLALVQGELDSDSGVVEAPVGRSSSDRTRMAVSAGGRAARTHYEVRERFAEASASLLECRLDTGRTHQIRVHLAAIGHPLVGDVRYGGRGAFPDLGRPFLHAHSLAFEHPASEEWLAFSSRLPDELEVVLAAARRSGESLGGGGDQERR